MEQHDGGLAAEYPRGRGYGHDYMRGGEVFGGYGYSRRDEYERPRGEMEGKKTDDVAASPEAGAQHPDGEDPSYDRLALELSESPEIVNPTESYASRLEHTFGSPGGNVRHSRSYYVTQAQLQQRVYRPRRDQA